MPAFTDPERATALRNAIHPAGREAWWREMNALLTGKWELLDRGRGLVALATTGFAAVLLLRLWDVRTLARARTPRSIGAFLLMAVCAWSGLVLPQWIWLRDLYDRGYLPISGDTIAIPAFGWALYVLGSMPIAAWVAWLVFLRGARLPASLWLWDRARPVRSAFWTAACGVLLLPFAAFLAGAAEGGRYLAVPLAAVLIYLVLSARAAVLSGGGDATRDAGLRDPRRAIGRVRAGRTTGAVRG